MYINSSHYCKRTDAATRRAGVCFRFLLTPRIATFSGNSILLCRPKNNWNGPVCHTVPGLPHQRFTLLQTVESPKMQYVAVLYFAAISYKMTKRNAIQSKCSLFCFNLIFFWRCEKSEFIPLSVRNKLVRLVETCGANDVSFYHHLEDNTV